MSLTGCGNVSSSLQSDVEESTSSLVNDYACEFYLDSPSMRYRNYTISVVNSTCVQSGEEYQLELKVRFRNETGVNINLKLGACSLVRESTNKKYYPTVDGLPNLPDVDDTANVVYPSLINLTINGKIPSDIRDDNYSLRIGTSDKSIVLHLYNTPNDKKETWTITYKVASKVVKTVEVKDNECAPAYRYDSEDHQTYSNDWYEDNSLTKPFSQSTPIRGNKTLYGKYFRYLSYNLNTTPGYATIDRINAVPLDNTLVIPSKYDGKSINIGEGAIKGAWNIEKIYIPNTVHAIYDGNFDLKSKPTIYYSGSEEEWKTSFVNADKIVTQNVVYNVQSPY